MFITKIRKTIRRILPQKMFNFLFYFYAIYVSIKKNLSVKNYGSFFDIEDRHKRCIRITHNHSIYLIDIINFFQYYWSAVNPIEVNNQRLVDYSTPRYHEVKGYNLHPVIFPAFAEPVSTTNQYLKFANLKNGSTVLDLGAYSGLTSIIFNELAGKKGKVIAVEADRINIEYIKKNFNLYEKITGKKISLLEGAIWENDGSLIFSSEGNMGSAASSIIGKQRGKVNKTASYKLSTIAKMFRLQKIDFIKCDIEGAESVIFKDKKFFKKYQPRIIIEPHIFNSKNTLQACIDQLSKYKYKIKKIKQLGVTLPLLECLPA